MDQGRRHCRWAKDGEVIVQITGIGPSGKTSFRNRAGKRCNIDATCRRHALEGNVAKRRDRPYRSRDQGLDQRQNPDALARAG